MMRRAPLFLAAATIAFLFSLNGQDLKITLTDGQLPTIAVPDLRGSGVAQQFMPVFNQVLWNDLAGSGMFRLAPKTSYPSPIPQQPQDFAPGAGSQTGARMAAWSGPPVSADYIAFGYTAAQNEVFVLYAYLFDIRRDSPSSAQLIASRYIGSADEAGARKTAHEFAADILALFGGKSLLGSHIYFTSDRTGAKEIWVMDADGSNQRRLTHFNFIAQFPAVSPDGSKIAFTAWPREGQNPRVYVFSVNPVRDLRFYNQRASVNGAPSFTPDGEHVVYMSSAGSDHGDSRIFIAGLNGENFRPITPTGSIDSEPKVNPKNPDQVVFSSGRSGTEQIYLTNLDGADLARLTNGTGEASNPSWHPNGQSIAFAWTRGYEPGHFNIFLMDVATRQSVQLTSGGGTNENPTWAPDGRRIAFASNRSGSSQIYTFLADGTSLKQLTNIGNNSNPVWGK